jgi:hypothetical protein
MTYFGAIYSQVYYFFCRSMEKQSSNVFFPGKKQSSNVFFFGKKQSSGGFSAIKAATPAASFAGAAASGGS